MSTIETLVEDIQKLLKRQLRDAGWRPTRREKNEENADE